MADGPEKRFQAKLVRALEARGATVWKTHGGSASAGWPDLMVARGGMTGWVEVKAMDPGAARPTRGALLRRLTGRQGARCRALAKAGVPVWVCAGTAGRRASGLEPAAAARCCSTGVPAGDGLGYDDTLIWVSPDGAARHFLGRLRAVADEPQPLLDSPSTPPPQRTERGS